MKERTVVRVGNIQSCKHLIRRGIFTTLTRDSAASEADFTFIAGSFLISRLRM